LGHATFSFNRLKEHLNSTFELLPELGGAARRRVILFKENSAGKLGL